MKRRKVRHIHHIMTDDELGRMVLENLGQSMNACFLDGSGAEAFACVQSGDVPEGFEESPEYLQALDAYRKRISKQ